MVGAEPDSPDLKGIVALLVVAAFVGVAAAR
jgi:hypothetical protein